MAKKQEKASKKQSKKETKSKKVMSEAQKQALKKGREKLQEKREHIPMMSTLRSRADQKSVSGQFQHYSEPAMDNPLLSSLDEDGQLIEEPSTLEDTEDVNEEMSPSGINEIPFTFGGPQASADSFQENTPEAPGKLDKEDIWSFGFRMLTPLGDFPNYRVYKNGQLFTTKQYPYSWEKLQEEMGGGLYKVQVVSGNTGKIIKSQMMSIAEGPNKKMPSEEPSKEAQGPSIQDMFQMIQNIQDKIKNESRQNDNLQLASMNSFNTTIMNMIQNQSKQTNDMIMKMSELNMQMNKNQMEMMTKALEGIGRSLSENKKDDGIDAMKLIALMKEAGKEGEEKTMKMMELIDKKVELAKEEAKELSDSDSDDTGGKNDSLSETLIKSLAPAIGNIIAANAQEKAIRTAHELGVNVEAHYPEAQTNPQAPQQKLPPARVQPPQPVKPQEVVRQPVQQSAQANQLTHRPVTFEKKIETKELQAGPIKQANPNMKQKIEALIGPSLIAGMQQREDSRLTSNKITKICENAKISKKDVLENYKLDDILTVASTFNLKEDEIKWLKETYACFENPIPVSRKPAASQQLQA